MSKIDNSGPAFPVADPAWIEPKNTDEAVRAASGMTLRQYAAIKLRVPNSGTDWLDEMIRASLRDEAAAKAMASLISRRDAYEFDTVNGHEAIAGNAFDIADAMLAARECER